MSDENNVIVVRDLGKCYELYENSKDKLKQSWTGSNKQYYHEFWALKNISFEVKKGEVFGVIGRNGAGKSTLLQLICGTLQPTSGSIQASGRIAALLELGAGFEPEFTGRENVYLNAAILGLSESQVNECYDEIVAFADIGDFINQPVKTYSSGMFVRLAFAVQACIEPDILIVDEALAVGDIFFRQKCYQYIERLRERGTSILLVTHGMGDIEQFCQRALLLEQGEIVFYGSAVEAVKHYYLVEQKGRKFASAPLSEKDADENEAFHHDKLAWPGAEAFLDIRHISQIGNNWARCVEIAICDDNQQPKLHFSQGDTIHFYYAFELFEDIEVPIGGLVIHNDKGIVVHGKNTLQYDSQVPMSVAKGTILRFHHQIQLNIAWGEYTFEIGLAALSCADYHQRNEYHHEKLDSTIIRICHMARVHCFYVGAVTASQYTKLLHHGVADLPGHVVTSIKCNEVC